MQIGDTRYFFAKTDKEICWEQRMDYQPFPEDICHYRRWQWWEIYCDMLMESATKWTDAHIPAFRERDQILIMKRYGGPYPRYSEPEIRTHINRTPTGCFYAPPIYTVSLDIWFDGSYHQIIVHLHVRRHVSKPTDFYESLYKYVWPRATLDSVFETIPVHRFVLPEPPFFVATDPPPMDQLFKNPLSIEDE